MFERAAIGFGGVFVLAALLITLAPQADASRKGEGSALEIGSPGSEPGQFSDLKHMAFGPDNTLYTLEGAAGNLRVQRFDADGEFLGQFKIDQELPDNAPNDPQRIAVSDKELIFITSWRHNAVDKSYIRVYRADGTHLRDLPLPGAMAIAAGKLGEVVVVASFNRQPTEYMAIIDDELTISQVELERPISSPQDVAIAPDGKLFVQAATNQIYGFSSGGKILAVIGGGTNNRYGDGSELHHTVAVDSKGNIYSITPGNPGAVTKFDPELTTVTRRPGQFYWYDAWNPHSRYTFFEIDRQDTLWVGTTGTVERGQRHHYRPCVVRTVDDYLDPKHSQVQVGSVLGLGIHLAASTKLPYNISYDPDEAVEIEFNVRPAFRRVDRATVRYRIDDVFGVQQAAGEFELQLEQGGAAGKTVSFTPGMYGWFTASFAMYYDDHLLGSIGQHVVVTPQYEFMPVLQEGEARGGWNDITRTAFAGLGMHRINTGNLDAIETAIQEAEKYGITLLVQIENRQSAEEARVRAVVERFKGRVKYWEIINEPFLSMSVEDYVGIVHRVVPIIRAIDPEAKIMGPAVCGIKMGHVRKLYELEANEFFDIISVHDYEGHESVDHVHWLWKYGQLRELMTANGDEAKDVWQTERGIPGVRANALHAPAQAVRIMLHRDLLETLGVPNEHNFYYYVHQAGYAGYPAYIWSQQGPFPAVPALRTRRGMTDGREYTGTLDFGRHGNMIFQALHYRGGERGDLITLRNFGTPDTRIAFDVEGGNQPVLVTDAFGNSSEVEVAGGRVELTASVLPTYISLAQGQSLKPPAIELGENIAAKASSITYSAEAEDNKPEYERLTDGIIASPHHGDPLQYKYFAAPFAEAPQTLEFRFDQPQPISAVMIHSIRADNMQTALIDYDLQYHANGGWTEIEQVRVPLPESVVVSNGPAKSNSWYMDHNMFLHRFDTINTDRLRIVVHRTTFGLLPDRTAREASGSNIQSVLHLREVQIFQTTARNN